MLCDIPFFLHDYPQWIARGLKGLLKSSITQKTPVIPWENWLQWTVIELSTNTHGLGISFIPTDTFDTLNLTQRIFLFESRGFNPGPPSTCLQEILSDVCQADTFFTGCEIYFGEVLCLQVFNLIWKLWQKRVPAGLDSPKTMQDEEKDNLETFCWIWNKNCFLSLWAECAHVHDETKSSTHSGFEFFGENESYSKLHELPRNYVWGGPHTHTCCKRVIFFGLALARRD